MSLQHAILGLLSYEPMSGYDMKSFLDNSINFFWSAQLSQIYRDLGTLEKKGCVSFHIDAQEGRPDRKVYHITPEGEKAFHEWLQRFPGTLSSAVRDEFSVRIFFGSRISKEELLFQLRRFIKEQQEQIASFAYVKKVVESYSKKTAPEEEFYWKLLLNRSNSVARTLINWAEESIQELENIDKDTDSDDGNQLNE